MVYPGSLSLPSSLNAVRRVGVVNKVRVVETRACEAREMRETFEQTDRHMVEFGQVKMNREREK